MKRIRSVIVFCFAISLVNVGFGQLFRSSDIKRADKEYEIKAFTLAIKSYQQALERKGDDTEAMVKLADSYRHVNMHSEAAFWYARALGDRKLDAKYKLQYGHVLKSLQRYDEAISVYQDYAKNDPVVGNHFAQSCNFAKLQAGTPSAFQVQIETINTSSSDFLSAFMGNNSVAYSSSRTDIKRGANTPTSAADNQLFVAAITGSGNLDRPYFLKSDLRSAFNEGPVAFSPDGRMVAYTKNNFSDGKRFLGSSGMELNLYIADVSSTGEWINAKPFSFNLAGYSTGFPAFSTDGKTLFFASNRPEGNGGFDIYSSDWIASANTWSAPLNLGAVVNTPGDEITPFHDGISLYFASDYHFGLGGYDIFMGEKSGDRYSKVSHTGNDINSPFDDFGFVYNNRSNVGYMTSNRSGGRGNEDIYRVFRAADIITVQVRNAGDGQPIPYALLDFSACGDGVYQADQQGNYTFKATQGLSCNVIVRKEGFFNKGVPIDVNSLQQQRVLEVSLSRLGEEFIGKVLAYGTQYPVSGVTVTATNQTTGHAVKSITDVNGDYNMALVPNSVYVLRYSRPGYQDVNRSIRTEGAISPDALGTISLPSAYQLPEGGGYNPPPTNTGSGGSNPGTTNPGTSTVKGTQFASGFAIQMAALSTPNTTQYEKYSNIGNIYVKQESNLFKVRLGVFSTRAEADAAVQKLKAAGGSGFVVAEQGANVPVEVTGSAAPAPGYNPGANLPPANTTTKGYTQYMIQLAALKSAKFFDSSKVAQLGTVVDFPRGDLTLKLLSGFYSVEQAKSILPMVQSGGFPGAFVVEYQNNALVRVR